MEKKHINKLGIPLWVTIGAVVLIVLLIVWLTYAMFLGDTDVAAPDPKVVSETVTGAIVSLT